MNLRKGGFLLIKVNVVVFLLLKGAFIVSICRDEVVRRELIKSCGIDGMYVGLAAIAVGCILIAKLSEWERKGVGI